MSSTAKHPLSFQRKRPSFRSLWAFVRREPLVHFVVLAGFLFVANALWSGADKQVIRVDRATAEFLIQQQADLALRPLTPEEEETAVASYIEDEILWREAYKRGLDRNARIRRSLVQNMRVLLSGDIGKPTEQELRAFYEQEKSQFRSPPALTLDHVFFRDPDRVPEATLAGLRNGADHRTLGDFNLALGWTIPRAGQRQLVGIFGPDGAREILAIEDVDWHGPILTPQGAHFVRVAERHAPRLPNFEAAASYLEGAWLMARQRERLETEVEALGRDYRIIIEPRER